MKVAIEVKNRDEANALKVAMADPTARAFTLVIGTLLQLPTDKARRRVLGYVRDHLEEDTQPAAKADTPT
jgi:hypothetical protein